MSCFSASQLPSSPRGGLGPACEASEAGAWGRQLPPASDADKAMAMYGRADQRLSRSHRRCDPSLLGTTTRSRGQRPHFYQVRIGADKRPAADEL